MADISKHLRMILLAARGEEVRDSLISALSDMNNSIPGTVEEALAEAKATGLFDGPPGPRGPKGEGIDVVLDAQPIQGSHNAVESGGIYSELSVRENVQNKVKKLSSSSSDSQYPSAKAVWNLFQSITDCDVKKY
jgi:hypothetical protein